MAYTIMERSAEPDADGFYEHRCPVCGFVGRSKAKRWPCVHLFPRVLKNVVQYGEPAKRLSLARRAATFAAAVASWIAAGCPLRTPERIGEIHAICKSDVCGKYLAAEDRCGACGCHLVVLVDPLGSEHPGKIAMATQSCPAGLW